MQPTAEEFKTLLIDAYRQIPDSDPSKEERRLLISCVVSCAESCERTERMVASFAPVINRMGALLKLTATMAAQSNNAQQMQPSDAEGPPAQPHQPGMVPQAPSTAAGQEEEYEDMPPFRAGVTAIEPNAQPPQQVTITQTPVAPAQGSMVSMSAPQAIPSANGAGNPAQS